MSAAQFCFEKIVAALTCPHFAYDSSEIINDHVLQLHQLQRREPTLSLRQSQIRQQRKRGNWRAVNSAHSISDDDER
jgi:hypothetical protein